MLAVAFSGTAHANDGPRVVEGHTHALDHELPEQSWREPNRFRTALELGAILGLGAGWYWIERDRQVADWDFPSLKERFTREAYINDNNSFPINYVWHSLGGTYYHVAGRSNDLSMWESAAWGLGASLVWEYGIEFREKISLNDILFTTGAGVAVGEFIHWMSRWLQQSERGVGGEIARWSVGGMHSAMDALDGRRGPRGPHIAHRFRVSSGYARANAIRDNGDASSGDSNLYHLRFQGALAALGDYLRPGDRRRTFGDGNLTSLEVELAASPEGSGKKFLADTMMFGWRHESIPEAGEDEVGVALAVGSSVGARYQDERYAAWREQLGALHLPGLAIDSSVDGGSWSLRARARAHFDYAGTHAMTYPRWEAANPNEVGKGILREQGYNYAWGVSTRVAAELSVARFALGVSMFHGRYRSQQGFDRQQEMLTVDQLASARYTDVGTWLRGGLTDRLFVELRRDRHYRSYDLEGFEGTNELKRHTLELGAYF